MDWSTSIKEVLQKSKDAHPLLAVRDLCTLITDYVPSRLVDAIWTILDSDESRRLSAHWHPGCWRQGEDSFMTGPIGRLGSGPPTPSNWVCPGIPSALAFTLEITALEVVGGTDAVVSLITTESKDGLGNAEIELTDYFVRILCDVHTKVYHELLKSGILEETCPEWYRKGHF